MGATQKGIQGHTVWPCSFESILYIQYKITPLNSLRIKDFITINVNIASCGGKGKLRVSRFAICITFNSG